MMSLFEILAQLKEQGYRDDLGSLFSTGVPKTLSPRKFAIDKCYRIDEMSDPEEQLIVYAISSRDGSQRGFVVNGYGAYSDPRIDHFLERLLEEGSEQKPKAA